LRHAARPHCLYRTKRRNFNPGSTFSRMKVPRHVSPTNAKCILEYPHKILGCNEAPMLRWRAEWIEAGFVALEALFPDAQRGRFCFGDSPTLADVSPVPGGKAPGVSRSI